MSTIADRRQRVVDVALSYLGTPYFPRGRIKGPKGGVDCLTLVANVFEEAGEVDHIEVPYYPEDWHMHGFEELYLDGKGDLPGVRHFCNELGSGTPPLPGDIMVWKFGHCFAHGAIVVQWPVIVHAWRRRVVGREDAIKSPLQRIYEHVPERGQVRPKRHFTLKNWT